MNTMQFILFLAWRNVRRYRKRSLQTFFILFCGALGVMLVDAYMKSFALSSTERIVSISGHVDIHAAGYLESAQAMPLDLSIPDVEILSQRVARASTTATGPGVLTILAPSIETGCMLSNGEISRAAAVIATPPLIRAWPGSGYAENPLLAGVERSMISGHYFGSGDEHGALLDEKYARHLGLEAGDSLILLGNDAYGSFSMLEATIIGVAREASLPGEAGCLVDLASLAPVLGLEGKATALSLWFSPEGGKGILDSRAEGKAVQAIMTTLSGEPGLEARPFSEISASYATMFEFLDLFLAIMMTVFAVVAATGMTNTILLSVQDRVKDLGTLRTFALTARQAGFLVYAETLIVGLVSALSAFVFGLCAVWLLNAFDFGIKFELASAGSGFPDSLRPGLFPLRLLTIAAIGAILPILAAILPARGARMLTIRESLNI